MITPIDQKVSNKHVAPDLYFPPVMSQTENKCNEMYVYYVNIMNLDF